MYRILGMRWYAQGLFLKEEKPGSEIRASELYRAELGDFVYNRLFAWKGSFGIVETDTAGGCVSGEFPCFQVNTERADAKFLHLYLSQERIWQEIERISSGQTNISRLRLKVPIFLAMEIPLPPLDEQRRIVARIEELAAKIEEARGLRQNAVEETKIVVSAETNCLFTLLSDVETVTLGQLGIDGSNPIQTGPFGAQLHTSDFVSEGVPVLNVGNVRPEGLHLARLDHVLPEKAASLARYTLAEDDLLFARTGATLGKVCLMPKGCDGWLMTGHLFRVRLDQSRCDPRFAFAALNGAQSVRTQVFDQVRGATRPGFNTTLLSRVRLPLPPLEEQRRIVAYLDNLQAKVDAVKRLQAETSAELEALLPSVLDRAFKGEL